jgi:hypothetical protein
MPFFLVNMDTYGAEFLTPSFVIYISKHHHHHHHQGDNKLFNIDDSNGVLKKSKRPYGDGKGRKKRGRERDRDR